MQYDENAEKYGYEGEMTPMKCDELKACKGDVTIPVYGTIADAEVYLKDKVDAAIAELKDVIHECEQVDTLLAEKDREIALLKERICNGDVSRLTWIDDCIAKDKEIEELKQTIDKLVGVKKSAEQILQNLLVCGLIKEWYFNGNFNAVLKADDPHLQIAELKAKLEDVQASAYAESVDAGMRERRLKRALWLARAERARDNSILLPSKFMRNVWDNVERKCRAKAEEYK